MDSSGVAGKTECKDPVLLMEGNREGSNLDPLVRLDTIVLADSPYQQEQA